MRKPFLKVWICAVVFMLLPLQAFATICWVDEFDNQYVVELGRSSKGKIPLYGYVKIGPGAPCTNLVDGKAPLFGTAVVAGDTAEIGWLIISIDKEHRCVGYRERLILNTTPGPNKGNLDGEFFFDSDLLDKTIFPRHPDRLFGESHLSKIDCPDEGNPLNPLEDLNH